MPDICQSSHDEYKNYVHIQLYTILHMFSYMFSCSDTTL